MTTELNQGVVCSPTASISRASTGTGTGHCTCYAYTVAFAGPCTVIEGINMLPVLITTSYCHINEGTSKLKSNLAETNLVALCDSTKRRSGILEAKSQCNCNI